MSDSEMTREARGFAERLRAELPLPVRTWNERLSTKSAERSLIEADVRRSRRKQVRDKVAAQIFLHDYFDSRGPA